MCQRAGRVRRTPKTGCRYAREHLPDHSRLLANVVRWAVQDDIPLSVDGTEIYCAPSVSPRRFREPTLDQGEDGRILLTALELFEQTTTVTQAVAQLGSRVRLDPSAAREVIEHLVDGRFLQPA